MILEHNVDKPLERGTHLLLAEVTSGTFHLEVSSEGSPYIILDGLEIAETVTKYVALPKCRIRAIISGVASIVLAKIEYT